jgi:hypothetical protein
MAAKKKGRPTVPVPSLKDLQVLFNRADVDGSKTVDEYEFLGLYQQVMDGTVKGLGDSAFSFYIRPHQLMQFGQHEHHPDTGSSLSHTLAHGLIHVSLFLMKCLHTCSLPTPTHYAFTPKKQTNARPLITH